MFERVRNSAFKTALGAICAAVIAAAPAHADDGAETFVQGILDEAEPILGATDDAVLYDGVAVLVDKYVDMRRVSLFVLGQYARQMNDEQKEEYSALFKKYATQVYQQALADYSGQKLGVTGSIDRSERDIIVTSQIVDPKPGDALTDTVFQWRVYRDREGAQSIVDAGADNVWLAIEQRSQFTSVIANNGGGAAGIEALLAQLREQTGG